MFVKGFSLDFDPNLSLKLFPQLKVCKKRGCFVWKPVRNFSVHFKMRLHGTFSLAFFSKAVDWRSACTSFFLKEERQKTLVLVVYLPVFKLIDKGINNNGSVTEMVYQFVWGYMTGHTNTHVSSLLLIQTQNSANVVQCVSVIDVLWWIRL